MSRMPGNPEVDEQYAAELLSDVLSGYGIKAEANNLRSMFRNKWTSLSNLSHMLHDAQERGKQQGQVASELEDERVSG